MENEVSIRLHARAIELSKRIDELSRELYDMKRTPAHYFRRDFTIPNQERIDKGYLMRYYSAGNSSRDYKSERIAKNIRKELRELRKQYAETKAEQKAQHVKNETNKRSNMSTEELETRQERRERILWENEHLQAENAALKEQIQKMEPVYKAARLKMRNEKFCFPRKCEHADICTLESAENC